MSTYLIWRLVKLISLVIFAGGVSGVISAPARPMRMKALWRATYGFSGLWITGYMLMKLTGRQLTEPWILWTIVASLISFLALALLAHRENPNRWLALTGLGGALTSVAVMVYRGGDPLILIVLTVVALALAAVLIPGLVFAATPPATEPGPASWDWFKWVARAEGVSLIVLMLIFMPLKRLAGINIDGGTGLIGWIHGTLFFVFLFALYTTGRTLGWSIVRMGIGFVLSLIPFGTFYFEYMARPREVSGG